MTRPSSRAGARRPAPALAASLAGAVDLSALKERAQAKPGAPSGAATANVVVVTEANFEAEVLQRSMQVPVVVALASARSEPSLALTETFARLAAEDNGTWVLAKVDVDSNMRIAQAFGVQSIPTIVAVAAGQPLADLQGPQPEPQLREWISAILRAVEGKLSGAAEQPAAEDPRFTAAEQALEDGDLEGAVAAYEAILAAEPGNTEAKTALRHVAFLGRAEALAPNVVEQANADRSNIDLQLEAADAEMFDQQPEAAFGRLIDAIKRTAGDDRTRLRTRLLELFELFDPAEPVVVAARRKLALALY
ncbi:tetratricopeptide repeat protein [Antrihabitans sp. YC2-6]|uniref:tetratricopeptide repeat protein n=1 Tax=Antrihabitans sp. YC2-6 TaxID=2799498 RepID=UPI0018F30C22|nr:tetratricopeptide repeat protein [Antrihabitans sp. YC2-6]MBJ8346596.1 tetratricopeptide repeat protein [Antrihabitans sp. YC2-6]